MDMASIGVDLVLKQAFSILGDCKLIRNVEDLIEELHLLVGNLKIVQALLLDAKGKSLEAEDLKGWLHKVEVVATDGEDLLEEYAYEVLRQKIECSPEKDSKVSPQVFPSIVSEIVGKMKEINLTLERICQEAASIGLVPSVKNGSEEHEVGRPIGDYVYKRDIFGREKDVLKITEMLINADDPKDFSVVGIVGIGGQGKTTVGRLVYENPVVVNHFDHCIWVSLSEDFDVVRIFQEMVNSITGNGAFKRKSKEAIMRYLKVVLKCRRYLIVCDDVCDANKCIWESMENDFLEISSSRGSKLMVITRSQEVAEIMKASECYPLDGLSNEDSSKLFMERALGGGRKETAEIVNAGRRIFEKCRGVPLAIELISGLLYSIKDEDEWLRISATWGSASDSDVILEAIRLSFDNLPTVSLKQCFLYCSVLPKNCLMGRENLIQIWMAQGLLNSSSNEHTLAATGDLYFNFLLQTSLLREPVYDDLGNIKTCKMHDLVHDFASHILKDYCLHMKLRYMIDNREVGVIDLSENYGVKFHRVRALYLVGATFGNTLMTNIRCLRVLILDDINIKELPSSIGELKFLRYLDVSETSINMFPDSIMKLYNLQTLRVGTVTALPEEFIILKNLRHVYGDLHIPRIGELVHLRTMPRFVVNRKEGCNMKELETLDNLKGKLIISGIENVISTEEASRSNLSRKFGISNLELHWTWNLKDDCHYTEVLEGLKPHFNLRVLRITGFNGYTFPSWMISSNHMHLRNLVQIQLTDCELCLEIPALGHLPNIQLIEIHRVDNVKCIGPEFYGLDELDSTTAAFPSLRKLSLSMLNLEKWLGLSNSSISSPRIAFPRLQELILDYCRSLTDLPEIDCHDSLTHLTISECCKLTVLPNWIQRLESIQDFTLSYSSLEYLPEMINMVSLRILSIRNCDLLVHLPDLSCLTSLRKLDIDVCPNLASILSLPCSLESPGINYCYILNALPELRNIRALRKLEISYGHKLVSIPNLPSGLRSLKIDCCNRLKAIPEGLESSISLERVCITSCSSLQSLDGLQHLSYLKWLEIGEFSDHLDHFPWQIEFIFPYLESLKLVGWLRLKTLPDLQRLPALRELIIEKFGMLEALPEWLGDFELLAFLYISTCDQLKYLPSAEALQRLQHLQTLSVWDCPLLKERWDGNGPEWHKISHIPNIGISEGFW